MYAIRSYYEDESIEDSERPLHQVQMAIGERIEAGGKQGNSFAALSIGHETFPPYSVRVVTNRATTVSP